MFVDTHTHLHHKQFNKDREEIMLQMDKCGVLHFVESPIDFNSNFVMREKLKHISNVSFAAGIHPTRIWKTPQSPESLLDAITRFARMQDTVAIGEIGLDHHIPGTEEFWELQETWFHRFIELSKAEQLPMILHIREAYEDSVRVLKEHGKEHRGIVHCFGGDWEMAACYIGMGLFLGIGGLVTMGNPELEDAVRKIPLDFMVLETDCPFVTPNPLAGRNTPVNLPVIAQKLADIKGISREEVEETTTRNAVKLFGF